MKRSDYVGLGAVGIIAAAFLLSETSDESGSDASAVPQERAVIYASVEECAAAGVLDRSSCEAEFRTAAGEHLQVAPKFTSQGECETSYGAGRCQSSLWNGASVFVPVLAGAMIANHLSSLRTTQPLMPGFANRQPPPCPPGQIPRVDSGTLQFGGAVPGTGLQQAIPGCTPQQARSGSAGTAGWRSYSTSRGDSIFFDSGGSRRNEVAVPRDAAQRAASRTTFGVPSAPSRSAFSSSSSVSRGGFGSSGRSFSSSSRS